MFTFTALALGTIADMPRTLQQRSLTCTSRLSVTVSLGFMMTLRGTSSIPNAFRLSSGKALMCCALCYRKMSVNWSETLDYDRRNSYVTCMTMICRGNPTCGADSA